MLTFFVLTDTIALVAVVLVLPRRIEIES